jgi:hypothetical protein
LNDGGVSDGVENVHGVRVYYSSGGPYPFLAATASPPGLI